MALAQPSFIFHVPRRQSPPPPPRRRSIQRTKPEKILLPQHTTTRESERWLLLLPPQILLIVRLCCSPYVHFAPPPRPHRRRSRPKNHLEVSPTVLGALPLSQHIGAAIIWAMYYVHWKRSLQLQLYLRSNIIRLSRRST